MSNHHHNGAGITARQTCEYWVNLTECAFANPGEPEPPALICGRPARFHRTFADGTRQWLCLQHRLYLLWVHACVTAEDWIQDHIDPRFCWCGWLRWPWRK